MTNDFSDRNRCTYLKLVKCLFFLNYICQFLGLTDKVTSPVICNITSVSGVIETSTELTTDMLTTGIFKIYCGNVKLHNVFVV